MAGGVPVEPSSGSQGQELEQALPWRNTFYEEPPMTCIPAQASLRSHATRTDPSPGHPSLKSVHTIVHAGKQTNGEGVVSFSQGAS